MNDEEKEQKKQEKKELDAMFDSFESGTVKTDAPATEPPVEAKTDPPSTDEPKTEPPSTDEPETDEPKTEAPTTDTPDEAAELKRENEELRKKVDEMSAPKTKAPSTTAPATEPPIEEQDFVGDLDPDGMSSKELNDLLNKVHVKAVTDTRLEFKNYNQATLAKVPELVSDNVSVQNKLAALTASFYKDNPDLKGFPKVVGTVFDELAAKNPNDPYDKVLEDVGVEVRNRLEIKKKEVKKKADNGSSVPPLPRKKGSRTRPAQRKGDPVTNEIGEMNESLNR